VPSASEAAPVYQKLVQALAPWVDLYLCETMSTADEAFHAAAAAVEFGGGKPVYVAWTLDETPGAGLRSGESIEVAFKKLAPLHIDAFLFNCTQPEAIEAGLKTLRQLTDKPLGGYANRLNRIPEGWTLDNDVSNTMREDMDETFFVRSCEALINAGAMMVGGCCGIGPSDIQALTKAMHSDSAA
jgi:S-methylmethionine-dependent homocysteine/selenocysteine methylase